MCVSLVVLKLTDWVHGPLGFSILFFLIDFIRFLDKSEFCAQEQRLSERCSRVENKWHIWCSSLTHRYSACGPMSTPGWTISELVDDFKGCLFILFFVFCLDSHATSLESGSHPHARRVCLLMIHTLAPWLRGAKAKTQVCTYDFTI